MRKFFNCIYTMRKSLLVLATVICYTTAATFFTACGDDNNGTPSNTDAASYRVELKLSLTESKDLMRCCDIRIEYNDGTGVKAETLTDSTWTRTITAKLPVTISFKKTITLKSGIDLSSDTTLFNCTEVFSYYSYILNAADLIVTYDGTSWVDKKDECEGIARDIAKGIKKGDFNQNIIFSFDANGKLQKSEI